jgi:hypothetical protein
MRNDPLARNIAEVIDDLYREHSPPRDHESLLALVQHQIGHVQRVTAKPLEDEIKWLLEEQARLIWFVVLIAIKRQADAQQQATRLVSQTLLTCPHCGDDFLLNEAGDGAISVERVERMPMDSLAGRSS